MKLITKAIERELRANSAATGRAMQSPDYGSERGRPPHDHRPPLKLFTPWTDCTWLLTELDDGGRLYGLCDLGHGSPELGYVMLDELAAITGPYGLKIERDRHFWPNRPLSHYAADARAAGYIAA